ncbi:MAG TPA: YbhB/YbcL family Raf kinase inhibitor-like protein [Chloroflexota bacterium]|nr:YbhB/YbcL family Raf kinase inhibitor-like protein [Chloroflexota bacterium]
MRSLLLTIVATLLLGVGCGAPAASGPTNAPAASPAAGASPAAKPGGKPSAKPSQQASPVAAASPVLSPAAAATPAGAVVNVPVLFSGAVTQGFVLQSSAFADGGTLPTDYSCDGPGGGMSPPLSWTGAPPSTRAFALVDQDPDAGAGGAAFTHWVVFNVPANITQLEAGMPAGDVLPDGALQGQNGRRVVAYQGACPPKGSQPHHYTFQLWALTGPLALPIGATILDLQRAMTNNVVGQTKLVALFAH